MSKDTKRQRRTRGTGSIREKRPGVYELKIGCGTRADGKPRYRYETVRGTRLEAERRLMEMSAEMSTDAVTGSGYTWEMFYERQFLPYMQQKGVTKATLATFDTAHTKIVDGGFAQRELTDLPTIAEVETWALRYTRGAAEQAVKVYRRVLNHAFRCGYFQTQPFGTAAILPKHTRTIPVIWDRYQVAQAIANMRGHRLYGFVLVMAGCGCRKEEALDLKLDTDFEIWELPTETVVWVTIDSAYTPMDGQKTTKNEYSIRTVPIVGTIAELLADYLRAHRTGYLVQSLKGERLGVTGLRKTWDTLFRDEIPRVEGKRGSYYRPPAPLHGLPHITPNKIRHAHTEIMKATLASDTVLSQYHGHVPPTIDGRAYIAPPSRYTHDETFLEAARKVDEYMQIPFQMAGIK